MPSFDHNEANRLTEAANAAQLKPTNEAPLRRAIRFQQASQSTDLQSGHSNMDNGKALPVPSSHSSSLFGLAECTVGNFMSRISKGCCRANRGRETRSNCILTHANCQCPHLPAYPQPLPVLLCRASLLHYSGQVREGRRLRTGRNCHFALCQRTLNAWAAKCGRRSVEASVCVCRR